MDVIGIILRWTHIASMTFLVGGTLFARLVLHRAMAGMPDHEKSKWGDRIASQWRGVALVLVVALLGSGLANLLRKTNLPPGYHMWFGIKMLLALHVIAVSILVGRAGAGPNKRARQLTGVAVSAMVVIAISAYLRALQQ
ncbi:MAG TPA: hypothetical protein VM120_16190 [Bryobacteraceae bacterium]|nr:hypothetical protein [Bryobacteraceae bacterium]